MKALLTLILFLVTNLVSAQYVPSTAGRITQYPQYWVPFNNSTPPTGFNYGCIPHLTNASWSYFSVCDSVTSSFQFSISYPASNDTNEFIIYGPLQDTININSQLTNAPIILCINLWPPFFSAWSPSYSLNVIPGIYYVMLRSSNPQPAINLNINYQGPFSSNLDLCRLCTGLADLDAEICLIDIDPATQRNKLTWEKSDTLNTAGHVIYRENSIQGVFDSIAYVPLTSFSEFIDMTATPSSRMWKYKIYKMDDCSHIPTSNEMTFTEFRTLFLQQAVSGLTSINLTWNNNAYPGVGPWISTYYIYRGISPSTMVLIDSVPNSIGQYTDASPLPGANYYQIEYRKSTACNPSMLPTYAKSSSNLTGTLFVGIPDVLPETTFSIFPNPVTDHFTLQLHASAQAQQNEFRLLTGDGKEIGVYSNADLVEKSGGELMPGIYTVQLVNAKGTSYKRFVKL